MCYEVCHRYAIHAGLTIIVQYWGIIFALRSTNVVCRSFSKSTRIVIMRSLGLAFEDVKEPSPAMYKQQVNQRLDCLPIVRIQMPTAQISYRSFLQHDIDRPGESVSLLLVI
jgi:hypothetical protein